MRKLRVKAIRCDQGWGKIQLLQEWRWWGWKTIDREEVPNHVLIAIGCMGYDDSGWVSRFCRYGKFGRDGVINQY